MSHNNTPALVDLRNPENMSAFAYKIKKAFNNNAKAIKRFMKSTSC